MKALIVDDRRENLLLAEAWLPDSITECVQASDGAEALERARQERFDLIVSDILMPRMDGFQLCRAIKEDPRLRDIPFVFVTATFTEQKDERLGLSLGAAAFFTKPIDPETFSSRIEDVLSGKSAAASAEPSADETRFLREYAQRVAHKLEAKVFELENANQELRKLRDELEERVRKRTRELEAKNSELSAANQELEMFTSSVAHDFRGPLRAIQGFAGILLAHRPDDPPAPDLLRRIVASAKRMQELMEGLLSYSRANRAAMNLTAVSVDEALNRACEFLRDDIARSRAAIHRTPLPIVKAHPAALEQVFLNLIGNAIKFAAERIPLEVRIESGAAQELQPADRHARVWVRDNGKGIPPEKIGRIFTLFEHFESNRSSPGHGIGLAVAKRSVERMGGRIGVECGQTQGAAFWIELPLADEGSESGESENPNVL